MEVNGREWKCFATIDYSHCDNEDGVPINKVEIVENDILIYCQSLFYPGILSEESDIIKPQDYDVIGDCLIVLKNYKVVSEFIRTRVKNRKKDKASQQNDKNILECSLFDDFCSLKKGYSQPDIIGYNAIKKEFFIENGTINGVTCLTLKCDEIQYYWNNCYSYKTGKKVR